MKVRRFKLNTLGKIVVMILALALIGGGLFAGLKTGVVTTGKNEVATNNKNTNTVTSNKDTNVVVDYDTNGNVMTTDKTDEATINLSLDEWIG